MSDAAQGEPIQHEVFRDPFKVVPQFEKWKTPETYRRYYGGKDLPGELRVWRVQNTGKDYGSVVAPSLGFEDSPDAEILTAGFNDGKESGAVGVGRQGNFLQWGFCASPSQMTEAGKHFFLNCICYIRKFDGQKPLVRRQSSHRDYALTLAGMIQHKVRVGGAAEESDPPWFSAEMIKKYRSDPQALVKYIRDRLELVYYPAPQCQFLVDTDLAALGITSNRKLETLDKLISLLDDPAQGDKARMLLRRYTLETFSTAPEWRAWFTQNRERLFFTDVGGYKFMVRPAGR